MALEQWPYECDPTVAGQQLFCANGTPDGIYGAPQLDGMRFVGEARLSELNGIIGSPGIQVSPPFDPLTGVPMTNGTRTMLVIPPQCKPYQLLVGWDMQGKVRIEDAEAQAIGVWMWPRVNGVVNFAATPLYESTLLTIVAAAPATVSIVTPIVLSANPTVIQTIPAAGPGLNTLPVTIEVEAGLYYSIGAPDGVSRIDGIVAAMRTYIQFV